MKRRNFLSVTSGAAVLGLSAINPFTNQIFALDKQPAIKAIAFDAFPIFDPRPILGLVKSMYPDKEGLAKSWFNKIFAYTWLRSNANRYKSFYEIIEDALIFTTRQYKVTLSDDNKNQLLNIWLQLKPWPDVANTLELLQKNNIHLSFLSNFSEDMLRTNARNAGIESAFEYFSTDLAGVFKPSPKAYQLGIDRFNLPKEKIAFCAFAGWDAVGASWFGYPTVWVNRLGFQEENLNISATRIGNDLNTLVEFLSLS